MRIEGKYIKDVLKFQECIVYIERGNLYNVSLIDASPLISSSYVPKNKSEFSLERLPKFEKGLIPYGSNYILEFVGKGGNQNIIYLKLNPFKAFQIKWVLKQYLIQSKDMKIDIIKYFIGGIIGLFFGYIGDGLLEKNYKNKDKIKNPIKDHVALGTWNRCNNDGSYIEYKITDQYMMILVTSRPNEIIIFGNKIFKDNLVSYQLKNGTKILKDNDTLVTIKQSSNKIVLMSTWGFDKYELNKAEFDYEEIDSTNLKLWKEKTLAEFHKRAKSKKCPDLRTYEEKVADETVTTKLELEILEEEKTPNKVIKN